MRARTGLAQVASSISTGVLRHAFRRPAENFPGKMALYIDPDIIGAMAGKLERGSIVVIGTNGKTTTTNLLADALELAGQRVVCNRTGANLDSGVATALLHVRQADWGVFESDELWCRKVLPQLKSDYLLLLNLFRDQLDRVGEIDKVQESIVEALRKSPRTVLLYNADDPLCTAVADALPNKSIAFGLSESLDLPQNTVVDAQMCQRCSGMLDYAFRQYGQLGSFRCDSCDFARHEPEFSVADVRFDAESLSFTVRSGLASGQLSAPFGGAYMVYNLLACYVAAVQLGIPPVHLQAAVDAFNPENGRLQRMRIGGSDVLLNLAKNPIGFNQNLKLIAAAPEGSGTSSASGENQMAAAFFLNDKEADGHDISWIWDVDFEELAAIPGLRCFAGGIRRNDLQMRLKYAGVPSRLVESVDEVVAGLVEGCRLYVIANYTALPEVREGLMRLSSSAVLPNGGPADAAASPGTRLAAAWPGSRTEVRYARPIDAYPGTRETLADVGAGGAEDVVAADSAYSGRKEAESSTPCHSGRGGRDERGRGASASPFGGPEGLRIVHLYPELLNLYGDGGNVRVLERRCWWRGIPAEVLAVRHGDDVDLSQADLVFLGGGPDREQKLASEQLLSLRDSLASYVEDGGVLLAICGGYQILGHEWVLGDGVMEGLHILDLTTKRVEGADRIIDNIVLDSPLASHPVVGFENHAGRTFIGRDMQPFGRVTNREGRGNNDTDQADGVRYRNVIGTYLHGPLLGKNPEIADWLLSRALERKTGSPVELAPLSDAVELAANAYIANRLR